MKIREILMLNETTSTQDVAVARARAGEPGGLLVVALSQVAGRGRGGRTWQSPPGVNLYASLVVRNIESPDRAHRPMMATAVSVFDAVRASGVANARIKWPNDIVVDGRKIAGILAESSLLAGRVEWVVVGVGLNVNWIPIPAELSAIATSLAVETGKSFSLDTVRCDLIAALERALSLDDPYDAWRARSLPVGSRVSVHVGNRLIAGRIADYERSGALVIVRDDGERESLSSGELSIAI